MQMLVQNDYRSFFFQDYLSEVHLSTS